MSWYAPATTSATTFLHRCGLTLRTPTSTIVDACAMAVEIVVNRGSTLHDPRGLGKNTIHVLAFKDSSSGLIHYDVPSTVPPDSFGGTGIDFRKAVVSPCVRGWNIILYAPCWNATFLMTYQTNKKQFTQLMPEIIKVCVCPPSCQLTAIPAAVRDARVTDTRTLIFGVAADIQLKIERLLSFILWMSHATMIFTAIVSKLY
jgi:hypothetical protein